MPRRSTEKLSDRFIRSLPDPEARARIVYDAALPGFGLRLTPGGARAFVLNYVVSGRERRMTIGRFPAWSTSAAREEARALRRRIDLGEDPMAESAARDAAAAAARATPTVADLFARYDREHLPTKAPRSAADDRSMWRSCILPALSARKVAEVAPDDVDRLHAEVSRSRPVRANRIVEVLRKAFNLAIRWGWRADNPAAGVRRNREEPRDRYLSPAEIRRLVVALDRHPERVSASAIRLLMLTGARRSEALGATWDQFDLEAGVWIKPSSQTKQRRAHRVPLSAPAVRMLAEMRQAARGRFVFPGADPERPLTDVKRTWLAVCRDAGLAVGEPKRSAAGEVLRDAQGEPRLRWTPTVRLHDLRHTYASILASQGLSLPVIGALLGHSQPQTTARYAHLLDDPLRAATEAVAGVVAAQSAEVAVMPDAELGQARTSA
ncbi:tyrosine-type recombinase/integrase [uncultured Albimonas sp.]|uniref:tyrosine-type recombinase/integrase n=1 Tax=uncultured Albimonas sp. TaxID=1331701 RepID=UPI0030EDF6DC